MGAALLDTNGARTVSMNHVNCVAVVVHSLIEPDDVGWDAVVIHDVVEVIPVNSVEGLFLVQEDDGGFPLGFCEGL